jgi:hypothetical protein
VTDNNADLPPDDVQLAFEHWMAMNHARLPAAVQKWLDSRKPAAPAREDAFAKFARMAQRPDKPVQQPGWVDSRPQQKGPRYG